MSGRAAFVYHGSSIDTVERTVGVLTARYVRAAVMDQILVDNREFFIHHLHWTPPLILIVLSRLDRCIQSATKMLCFKRGWGVAHSFNCTTAFVDMRLADTCLFIYIYSFMFSPQF